MLRPAAVHFSDGVMSLKQTAITGGKWITISTIINTLLQFARIAVLARLLLPDDFGLMAIVMIAVGLCGALSDMGINNAIIHRQNITPNQLSSIYWLNIFSGFVIFALVLCISPLVGVFYDEPRLVGMINTLSPVFIITAIGNQFRVLSQKEMRFHTIAIISVLAEIFSTAAAIIFAMKGFGVYSLVYAAIILAVVNSILFLIYGLTHNQAPKLVFSPGELKGFYAFGLYQMGERVINFYTANIDKILIGKMAGMQVVGFYSLAWQLIVFPLSKINPIINSVAFPTYAKVQNDVDALSAYYSGSVKLLSLIVMPILAFIFYFSADVVLLVFGPGWEQSVVLVQILALVGALKALANPGGSVLLAIGRADVGFWWNVFYATILTIALVCSLSVFPTAESAAYTLLLLSIVLSFLWHSIVALATKIKYRPIIVGFAQTAAVSFVIGGIIQLCARYYPIDLLLFRLAFSGALYALIYALYLYFFERTFIHMIKR
jgi:O-antigen/teichoic acid export membrane protein